jgi:hypothetical protein
MAFIRSNFECRVAAPMGVVNNALTKALRDLGFVVVTERLTLIEAHRGSPVAMVVGRQAEKVPLQATIRLTQGPTRCLVAGELSDAWNRKLLGLSLGLNTEYARAFEQVQDALETVLKRAAHTSGVSPMLVESQQPNIKFLERANEAWSRLGEVAAEQGNAMLTPAELRPGPSPWEVVQEVWFESDEGQARPSRLEAEAMLTVGVLIALRPGPLREDLRTGVEGLVSRVEIAMSELGASIVVVPLANDELPVIRILRNQARVRETLEVRTLRICKTCGQRKIINPDFQRLAQRNRRLRMLFGGFGASITTGGITPFVLVGSILRSAVRDPDFVCARCQGLEYDEGLVTFCPSCGAVHDQVILTVCHKCQYDFRSVLTPEHFWLEPRDAETAELETPAEAPADWYPDPYGRHEYRYWDGSRWTEYASDDGDQIIDPTDEDVHGVTQQQDPV